MKSLILSRETFIWVILMALTALSWWLGADPADRQNGSASPTAVILILVAFFKVRLVIQYFMELKDAPWALRGIGEAWVFLTCASVLTLMMLG